MATAADKAAAAEAKAAEAPKDAPAVGDARATDTTQPEGTPPEQVDVDPEALDALASYVEGEVQAALEAAREAFATELQELADAAPSAPAEPVADAVDEEHAAIVATWPEGTGWFFANGRPHHVDLGSPSHLRLITEGAIPVPAPKG